MNTIICKQLEKYKDKNGKIIGYCLIDSQGNQTQMKAEDLKAGIKAGTLKVVNLTLTRDDRLVDGAEPKEPEDNQVNSLGMDPKDIEQYVKQYVKQYMRVVKDTVKHEAFGVQIDFDIPDFIKINNDPRWFNVLKNNGYVLERYLDSELANSRLFFFDFSGTKESLNDNIISVYDSVSKKMVQDSVSVLAILYMMANGLAGLNPDSTEQDIMSQIQNNKWIKGLLLKYSYLRNRYLVVKAYNPEEEAE